MWNRRLIYAVAVISASVGTAIPEPAAGQWLCGLMYECIIPDPPEGAHENPQVSFGDNKYPHSECYICVDDEGAVEPEMCHPECIPEEENAVEYRALLAAARAGDIEAVTRFLKTLPQSVSVNARRNSLQITGCEGTIVANLLIPPALASQLLGEQP
jgi:hypothetical protein